jgi:hypothetical protein
MFDRGAWFRLSISAATRATRIAAPTIWSSSGPHQPPLKYSAGKVAKIANVGTDWSRDAMSLAALKASIAGAYRAWTSAAAANAPTTWATQ